MNLSHKTTVKLTESLKTLTQGLLGDAVKAVLMLIGGYLLLKWPPAKQFLLNEVSVRTWLFLLQVVLSVVCLWFWGRILQRRYLPTIKQRYTVDECYSFKWTWNYGRSRQSEIQDLTAFCLIDNTRIIWIQEGDKLTGLCGSCHRFLPFFRPTLDLLYTQVAIQFEKRISSGEWKQATERLRDGKQSVEKIPPTNQ